MISVSSCRIKFKIKKNRNKLIIKTTPDDIKNTCFLDCKCSQRSEFWDRGYLLMILTIFSDESTKMNKTPSGKTTLPFYFLPPLFNLCQFLEGRICSLWSNFFFLKSRGQVLYELTGICFLRSKFFTLSVDPYSEGFLSPGKQTLSLYVVSLGKNGRKTERCIHSPAEL